MPIPGLMLWACYLLLGLRFGLGTVSAQLTPHTRNFFHVGGEYIISTTGQHLMKNEMYAEELNPVGGSTKPYPLIFVHGLSQTGTNWLNTPDNRPGWASYFLAQGYTVYLIDQPSRGRSPWLPSPDNATSITAISAEAIQSMFTAPELYNSYPQAVNHTQWPGNGTMGNAAFDAFYAAQSPSIIPPITTQTLGRDAGVALLDKIGTPVILVGHSQGVPVTVLLADQRPQFVKAMVMIEPAGPPFIDPPINGGGPERAWGMTDIPVQYTPPVTDPNVDIIKKVILSNSSLVNTCILQDETKGRAKQMKNLVEMKTVVITGSASWHMGYDWCTTAFLKQAGLRAEQIRLVDVGIVGNGHMMFMEKNGEEIAGIVGEWVGNIK